MTDAVKEGSAKAKKKALWVAHGTADKAHGSEGLLAGVWDALAYILATMFSIGGSCSPAVVAHGWSCNSYVSAACSPTLPFKRPATVLQKSLMGRHAACEAASAAASCPGRVDFDHQQLRRDAAGWCRGLTRNHALRSSLIG